MAPLIRPAGMSWAALDQLHAMAVEALNAHAVIGGVCRVCGTAGACDTARLAENNLDMYDPAPTPHP
jgi:hypothetical protein